ncbi:nucleotidyltransferase family protein [Leptospira brenneri]|uniref:CBS domain-containing protein n=1 Tax=Leptospira brenneri TaxID=2023182 RepID=A0A2M9Y1S7_9LEPT|nr:nucleotidyltransferase family protein [Leptospira brenneri]PJZ45524.1 nucleotidyl transferase [Leptospira brenneri]TGK92017.1 CBS domain-containing protein [Leptospira brenneri]
MNWKKAILRPDDSIEKVIQNLDQTGLQVVLVVDESNSLLGTITDGDIRRGLLKGLDLSQPVHLIMKPNSFVVLPSMSRELVLQLMKANKIHQIPIVDEDRKVLGLHVMDEILQPNQLENLFVIMAGGKGVRLRPYTENCPKPMLPVAGKPMLEHIIEKAMMEGFRNFLISVFYLGHMIEDYFKDGSDRGIRIEYVREETPLGTAGALGYIKEKPTAPFIVTNGDVMTDIRYSELLEFHCKNGAAATMSVRMHEWQHPFGVVRIKGVDILGFEEKPIHRTHVNAGIYALEPQTLDHLEAGQKCDMPTLFTRLGEAGNRIIVYPMHEPWVDVGRKEDLAKIRGE